MRMTGVSPVTSGTLRILNRDPALTALRSGLVSASFPRMTPLTSS
jgi:hypothetical protein